MIKFDPERSEVCLVGGGHVGNNLLLGAAFGPGPDRDRSAVSVVGADIDCPVADHFLKPDPDIGLQILNEMADVNMAIRVGKGGSDEKLSHGVDP